MEVAICDLQINKPNMAKTNLVRIPYERVVGKIYLLRNQKVMLDRDLSVLYGIETKRLKEAVKRNKARFPADFMIEMKAAEFKNWRSQFATSNSEKMGLRYAPYCFTEQGVAMLSSVLNTERAILVNVEIIRAFTRVRNVLAENASLRRSIEKLEHKSANHSQNIELVFSYIEELRDKINWRKIKTLAKTKVGYKLPASKRKKTN